MAVTDNQPSLLSVEVGSLLLSRFEAVLSPEEFGDVREGMERARTLLRDRTVWNVNSTARGGGVAEMLVSLLAYARGASIDARWMVIGGNRRFFALTKRLHNRLHGFIGDGGALGEDERRDYEATLAPNARALCALVQAGDAMSLHDPQTAGLIELLKALGIPVVWRCHVGVDAPNDRVREAWSFLEPYVSHADAVVFSRAAFAWENVDESKRVIITPSIDAYSSKNHALDERTVEAILGAAGLRQGETAGDARAGFIRMDGADDVVHRRARTMRPSRCGPEMPTCCRSRAGMRSRTLMASSPASPSTSHRIAPRIWSTPAPPSTPCPTTPRAPRCSNTPAQWTALPEELRARIHLALLPMEDPEENGALVNALQRGADVVVQKSVAEGFGLTVAEAMWKSRPVVASRLGGIQDQIEDGVSGVRLDDPRDLTAFGTAVTDLLENHAAAAAMGDAAAERVRGCFLGPHSLLAYAELLDHLL